MRFSTLLVLLGSLLVPARAAADAAAPPNLIVIVVDDLGWKDLGCCGSTFYQSPNIDRLAAAGVRFAHAYAACPVCSPTRASILTGKYPARLHLTDWLPGRADRPAQKLLRPQIRQSLPRDEVTLARALKPLGYTSASIGKWHLGGENSLPEQHGFDINRGGTQTGSPPGGYFKFKTPTLSARDDQEYLTDRLAEEAEKFIDQHRERPFFLYLAHYGVHIPLQAKKEVADKYRAKKAAGGHDNPIYAAMIESVDDSVGRIVKKLDELKLSDRTVILLTSDNGGLSVKEGPSTPATTNAPLRTGKGYLYEGGIRVPLIIRAPGVKAGVSDVPVCSIDFFATLLDLAGAKAEGRPKIDGLSLVPLLKQEGKLERAAIYWHYPHYSNQGGRPGGAVRRGDHKLIEFYEDGKLELYNLKDDPGEAVNLAEKMPDQAKQLHQLLVTWRKSVDAQMPTPNPDYDPKAK